mgnify:FL=1
MSGVPLPVALPIAMDPQAAQAGLVEGARVFEQGANVVLDAVASPAKAKRKISAYNRKYKAAFKKVSPTYKLKNGQWKKNGFRSAVRAAHKMAGVKK